jgi:hypothetical protein
VNTSARLVKCGAPADVFLAHGKGYRHYRGALTATSKPRPYKADHIPVVTWRPAADGDHIAFPRDL